MTVPPSEMTNYKLFKKAFRDYYVGPEELKWKEKGTLSSQGQKTDELVEDYVTRIRKGAKRLTLDGQTVFDIVLNGLWPTVRMHVMQRHATTIDELIKFAKIAEAVVPTASVTSNALMELVRASVEVGQKQADELKQLARKLAALSVAREETEKNMMTETRAVGPRQSGGRPYRPTPQRQQLNNYGRNSYRTTPEGGAQGFRQATPVTLPQQASSEQATTEACTRCGSTHEQGRCRVEGAECWHCGKKGQFARVCRSARRQ